MLAQMKQNPETQRTKRAKHLSEKKFLSLLCEHCFKQTVRMFQLWLYGAAAVVVISLIGLLAINLIPYIQQRHHQEVLQLLVGLAIGTLTSDALLHLLPHVSEFFSYSKKFYLHPKTASFRLHFNYVFCFTSQAFSGNHSHEHQHQHLKSVLSEASTAHDHDHHDDIHEHSNHSIDPDLDHHTKGVWYGLMALTGIIGFLIFERVLTIVSDLCHKPHRKTSKIANCNRAVGEKISNHNASMDATTPNVELEKLNTVHDTITMLPVNGEKLKNGINEISEPGFLNTNSNTTNDEIQLTTEQCHRETIVYQHNNPDGGFVVQLTDHHHHHQHQHQKGAKSIIMMIVTGDGLHNFFDGLAIGIAFAGNGLAGGFSTSVAILCHELPHEVGDFAVLLSAGLSVKRAVLYNTLSAVLCFIGMTVGIVVGNLNTAMLSAVIAGMFLYIALVNMIPQLDCCPTQSGTTRAFKLSIQLVGISIGVAIMCGIALYETRIQNFLN
ncbi:zinc transporter ZIP10-like protein [Dinothrombium tinctorium]|uniref:Zinc transporter ZIP10-like protein n=1 Tax=Dinothrombium tinctorium TaxID=1965070 RepID=A0A443QK64_9ACAR|nr:zinc transporter ZIP10-like protein [Dinothrombium tinctorium]